MRAIMVGAVESTAVAIQVIAATPGWTVPLVVTLKTDRSGRHSDFNDLEDAASLAGADIFRCVKVNDQETLDVIAAIAPDYVFVIGWSQICGSDFLATTPDHVIGYHPAPLPRLRGRAVLPWTILANEPISAGSLFWMNEGVDDGAILEQQFFHLAPRETAAGLYQKHMIALDAMLKRALAGLASGAPQRIPQDPAYATWAAKRTPEDGRIDWNLPVARVDRLIRALGKPYPGAFTDVGSRRLTIWDATPIPDDLSHQALPGQIVKRDGNRVFVKLHDGLLVLEDWECSGDGKLPMHTVLGKAG